MRSEQSTTVFESGTASRDSAGAAFRLPLARPLYHADVVSDGHALLTSRQCAVCCDYLRQLHIWRTDPSWSPAPRCRTQRLRPERISPRASVPRVPSGQQLRFVKEHE
jgi:hypothetical protein